MSVYLTYLDKEAISASRRLQVYLSTVPQANQQPTTNNQQATTNKQQPTSNNQQATTNKQPTNQQATMGTKHSTPPPIPTTPVTTIKPNHFLQPPLQAQFKPFSTSNPTSTWKLMEHDSSARAAKCDCWSRRRLIWQRWWKWMWRTEDDLSMRVGIWKLGVRSWQLGVGG